MPLIKKIESNRTTIAIWRIDEPLEYFYYKIYDLLSYDEKESYSVIKHSARKLEYLCSRYLLWLLEQKSDRTSIIKKHKKPYLLDSNKHISISHSKEYIACSISSIEHAIDIEQKYRITPQVVKTASRFYNDNINLEGFSNLEKWLLGECIIKMGYKLKNLETLDGLNFISYEIERDYSLGFIY